MCVLSIGAIAMPVLQDDKTKPQPKAQPKAQSDDEEIPDSLLHPRWPIRKTAPVVTEDADSFAIDLKTPDNIRQGVEYNDSLGVYFIGSKIGSSYLNTPLMMTPEEYNRWSERRAREQFFRDKNAQEVAAKGKEKFDFTDMHFSLGPAEKIFGPGGVRIKTQGSAELKIGMNLKNIDNPSLPIRNRRTTAFDFDEKINLNLNGKVGDKINMNLNYNTDATFEFDTKNIKLRYEGKEDEIIKLVEAGDISFPSNSSLIQGASSLFGVRTDMQFGRLKLQAVISSKNSQSKSVSSKGGTSVTPFEIDATNYEENRHFFLAHYFRQTYDEAMSKLPNLLSGIEITRMEVWVTNKTGTTSNSRNIIGFTDLGEGMPGMMPSNRNTPLYETLVSTAGARDIDNTLSVLGGLGLTGGVDYEKLQSARLLTSSEYTINKALGYISLKAGLQTDQVLAVAFEYKYNGVVYQVGELTSDNTNTSEALFVKTLKNSSNTPLQSNWRLMMKNVYFLASTVENSQFRLDVKYQSDTAGVYLSYIPETQVKDKLLIQVMGADRLDDNMKARSNGRFDYVQGYTIQNGRVFFPKAEPFGEGIRSALVLAGVPASVADKYAFTELYDTTKTAAKQIAEKNKYMMVGQFRGTSANVISLGAVNVPQGSVKVTAGGTVLVEGSDYSVDYSAGEVTILNQSYIDAGTPIDVSLETNTDYGQISKRMFGLNFEYEFSKKFQIGGTIQHLHEQALTTKVAMGSEPLSNTLWGVNINWKTESQWLTNVLDKIPFLNVKQPSQITFRGDFAHLIAKTAGGTQDNASYIDDFEDTKTGYSIIDPKSWQLSSVPSGIANHDNKTDLSSGFDRALLSWYTIDPLFTYRSSSLTPAHIKSDLNQLSNHYVREVYVSELYPNRQQSNYNGATNTLPILNLAYYPSERGPYNFSTAFDSEGRFLDPASKWGGMMRKLDVNDFETANIEYIEFWLLDPFIYTRGTAQQSQLGGQLKIDVGEVSEDVLCDGKKFYESGMAVDGTDNYEYTSWGKIPRQSVQTYSFATTTGSRMIQDVGFNGLNDVEEMAYEPYAAFNSFAQTIANDSVRAAWLADPANDNYHYFRGDDLDAREAPILERYKRIVNPQGNSPEGGSGSYDPSYKTGPDVEDLNQDFTMNEYERYFEYVVDITPDALQESNVGVSNYITDMRKVKPVLRNGVRDEEVTWYKIRIPLNSAMRQRIGSISDFSAVRFMRMYLTGFTEPIVLRFGSLDLVQGKWRSYEQQLSTAQSAGEMQTSAVNIEEHNDKQPVNYVLPPGITRETDPSQPQLVEANEQALNLTVNNLGSKDARAVYKKVALDLRSYKRLQMFVHANALVPNNTNLIDGELAVFVRLGSDYKNNYYEYEIPLTLTPANHYDRFSSADCIAVWPMENMLDIDMSVFTDIKRERNAAKSNGQASYNREYQKDDSANGKAKNIIRILGNPSLGEVKTMMIGVRNISTPRAKSGEVWVNELRLLEAKNEGGWAASGTLNIQLSDFGTINLSGKIINEGFGGLEQTVTERTTDNTRSYNFTANLELGKFFPEKAQVTIPFYYSVSEEHVRPKYNPLDTDMELDEALDAMTSAERDSIEAIAVTKRKNTNFSISNMRVGIKSKLHPMPYDPANFSLSYSHSHSKTTGETRVYETDDNWRGALNYSYTPVYKTWEPFKKSKSKSKWMAFPKAFGINYLPQNIAFNTEITRTYHELQERDVDNPLNKLPLSFSSQFLWNRDFSLRWDLTKNLHMNFQSATHAEIEEPYRPVNKDLYPDDYAIWKDSVWNSIKNLGTPLDYSQQFSASYQVPLNKLPLFDWLNADANYTSNYRWIRGTELEDGTTLGNTISNSRNITINSTLNMEMLYNHIPFLKKANEAAKKDASNANRKQREAASAAKKRQEDKQRQKEIEAEEKAKKGSKSKKNAKDDGDGADKKAADAQKKKAAQQKKPQVPANVRNAFQKELALVPDSGIEVKHGKKTKRVIVSAKTEDGKAYQKMKFKVVDENTIRVFGGDSVKVKLSVIAKKPTEQQWWYRPLQKTSRVLMMVRSIGISYRDQRSMTLPGFLPNAGDMFGQNTTYGGSMAPGLGFAFGFNGDDYIQKSIDNNWLLRDSSMASPATVNTTSDLQIKATIEPIQDLKIDLNASRTVTKARSIQFQYDGMPTTHSGSFTMTTISIKSALEGMGSADDGYHSPSFEKFCSSIADYQQRLQSFYATTTYPKGMRDANGIDLGGSAYNPELGTVDMYSSDVLIPAFINAYTGSGGGSLDIFPALKRLLPNWTIRYSGLVKLPWLRDHFKSININHSYKSVFSIGSYSSFSTFHEFMDGRGFIVDSKTNNPVPSSMYNVSTVSINEAFSPLLGIDVTFLNNMTLKAEYRQTRVLSLSTTSIQVNEALSKDWVVGVGYKVSNFNIFGSGTSRKIRKAQHGKGRNAQDNKSTSTTTNSGRNQGVNHDLNLRLDISLRKQAAITRDIRTATSAASSGNSAFKMSLMADYTLSRLLTMSAYYDRQTNTPLLSSSGYPTTTHDFGLSLKISLTR